MTETQNNEATLATDDGATVVITHRIRAEQNAAYEAWLDADLVASVAVFRGT